MASREGSSGGLCEGSRQRGGGNGQRGVHSGVSGIFIQCSFVMESKHLFLDIILITTRN